MTCIEESTQQSIGHLLLEDGRIDDEMLSYALKVQQVSRERLGDILQHLRLVTDRDIAWVVAKQAKRGSVGPDTLQFRPEARVTSAVDRK